MTRRQLRLSAAGGHLAIGALLRRLARLLLALGASLFDWQAFRKVGAWYDELPPY